MNGALGVRRGSVLVLAGLVGSACSESSTGPDALADINLAVATIAAEATLEDVRSMVLGTWGIGGAAPVSGVGNGPNFNLAPGDHFARTRPVTFYGGDGDGMDAFDELLTESINIAIDVEGSVSRTNWSAELERHRDFTVSGLSGEETQRTWNGTGTNEHSRARTHGEHGEQEYSMASSTLHENVVVGLPRNAHPWPLSGTVTKHFDVTVVNGPNGDVTHERTVVIVFNGTRYVTLTVDGEAFEVDLADRQGHRPGRRGNG